MKTHHAFDLKHRYSCITTEPNHVEILDNLDYCITDSWQYEFVKAART